LSPNRTRGITRGFLRLRKPVVGGIAGLTLFGCIIAGHVQADPADDALAKLTELSRQAEQTTEAMHSAQLDLNNKLAVQQAAEAKHVADAAAVESAKSQLATFQGSVDKLAAAQYMGGRTDGLDAMLTATSPQGLIDQLAVQRVMASEMSAQMKSYRDIGQQAALAEQASAKSAADAKTAAEQAAAVRADLQSKQSKLQVQIAVVKSQYQALTPAQRDALAALPPIPAAATGRGAPGGPRHLGRASGGHSAWRHRAAGRRPRGWGPRGGHRHPGCAEPDRVALFVGWLGAEPIRLLRPGDVVLPAGRHLTAALQPGPGSGRAAGVDGSDATW
jgi:peptidoglycan DL-endopeptidase CwlO